MKRRIEKLRAFFLDLPKSTKIIIYLLVDSFLCLITTWLSLYLRLGEVLTVESIVILPSLISIILAIPVF